MNIKDILEEIKDTKEHLEWAISASKNELSFGMGKKESCYPRELRLRGSATSALRLIQLIEKHLNKIQKDRSIDNIIQENKELKRKVEEFEDRAESEFLAKKYSSSD